MVFGNRSNANDSNEPVDESYKGISATLLEPWHKYVAAPITYLSHSYLYNRSSSSDAGTQTPAESGGNIGDEMVNANRGLSAAILTPWRQYVVAPAKYLSSSTQFAVLDKTSKKWLFRLDKAHVKGAKYPHMNVNHALTGVRDPHTRMPGAVVNASGSVGKVMRNAGDFATVAALGIDTYKIGSTAHKEYMEKGGIGAETGKVAGGISGAWTCGFLGATLGGKAGSMAGGLFFGPVGAGVFGIVGAVAGGVGGSIKGRNVGEQLAENVTEQVAERREQIESKM